ncbi:MAG TPA: SET domain-containing protein-lysine N-methyltransferase [Candidatus Kapabacteria bacterium]|jgi:SET domain-containing protein|nr:SET domain-containing protein-lysine N-methyltransferase [Candidatus Kapabacteria bacterium]
MSRDFTRVGRSRIEGTGVFAKRRIPRGTRIFEYLGQRRTLSSVLLDDGSYGDHTYLFRLNEQILIDGSVGGNDARFVNHGCEPNCEAYIFDDRLYFYAMRDIRRGEELTIDYHLTLTLGRARGKVRELYACHCGAPSCRGTMLATRRRRSRSQ